MAIDLNSGTGLFDRVGKLCYVIQVLNSFLGGTAADTLPKEVNDALAEYDAGSNDVRACVEDLLVTMTAYQNNGSTLREALQAAAEETIIVMANADNPLPELTLGAALDELIFQMRRDAKSVDASEPTIAAITQGPKTGTITGATQANPVVITTSAAHGLASGAIVYLSAIGGTVELNNRQFTVEVASSTTFKLCGEDGSAHTAYTSGGKFVANAGHGVIVTSLKNGKGQTLENAVPEDIVFTCTNADTEGAEDFTARGEATQGDKLHHAWPDGSGLDTDYTVRDLSAADHGFLTNGGFENFTGDTPDNWSIVTGTTTTHFDDTTSFYSGAKALRFKGDGSTLTQLRQDISAEALEPRKNYPVHVRLYAEAIHSAGVLVLDLFDGTSVINDDTGTANSLSITLANLREVWQAFTAVFRLPNPVPATVYFRIRLSTAQSNTHNLRIDDLCLGAEMEQAYEGGPFFALFAGATDHALDDVWLVTVTNAQAGAFQTFFDRLFDDPERLLPSATGGSETVNDNLIG